MPIYAKVRSVFSRAMAGCIGAFGLMNLAGDRLRPGFDATLWWLDLRGWPVGLARTFLFSLSLTLLMFAVKPVMSRWRRFIMAALVGLATLAAMLDAARFFSLAANSEIAPALPLPLSLLIAVALMALLCQMIRGNNSDLRGGSTSPHDAHRRPVRLAMMVATLAFVAVTMFGFPLAQMFFFGKTSYARPAQAIIVLGARAYADGQPSLPLADRVRTACDLYHQGYAPLLIFSGGPGDGAVHETEAMRRFAISLGVPAEHILLDPHGTSTQATADHTGPMLDARDIHRVLVVSHFYHLPRIKLTFARQGREVYTVPARESRTLRAMPMYLTREVAAIWWYYLRPLCG